MGSATRPILTSSGILGTQYPLPSICAVNMETKANKSVQAETLLISAKDRWADPDSDLRYLAETSDQVYKTGAYNVVESPDFSARMAVQAGYVISHGAKSVLDIGCGTGELFKYLNPNISYVGIDLSPTAIEIAKKRYGECPNARFYCVDFREWQGPEKEYDCITWAGIGRAWIRGGSEGDKRDWLEILHLLNEFLSKNGVMILEATKDHLPKLVQMIAEDYNIVGGCDIDCLVNDQCAARVIRVVQPK